ncbi:hypothetical protein B0H12DRAFT_1331459 [Mycena haematopus]|nr:hypothetical protein B0H12DRAFT_1331459 [Mycena haematopus]
MGFKPKKSQPPPLTIHSQYPPVATPHRSISFPAPMSLLAGRIPPRRFAIGRAPSNSVSSSRSRGDSIGPTTPKTPEDPAKSRRGSLLTLSDTDPFAARVVSLHSPSDPNRLSAFSNSSVHDTKSNESANRVSYASSSSQSFRMGGDLSPQSILSNKLTGPSLRSKDLTSLSGDPNRLSEPDPPPRPRPAMRARGMTDGGIERSNFLRSDPFMASPKQSPSFPSRQVSLSRRTPPPNQELPLPPSPADDRALGEFSPINTRPRVKQQAYEPSPKTQNPANSALSRSIDSRFLRFHSNYRSLSRGYLTPHYPREKRLFSTSSGRRPSQSTLAISDDARSLNAAPEQEINSPTSCWIDTDLPRSSTSEYTPQQIMSPAEMLQVEASVEAAYQRPRTTSIIGGRKRSNSDRPSIRSSATSEGMYIITSPFRPNLLRRRS